MKIVHFLDCGFSLLEGTVSPHIQPNSVLKYVNAMPNHPNSVIKQIPKVIECRLSKNSSSREIFNERKKGYVIALNGDEHKTELKFI